MKPKLLFLIAFVVFVLVLVLVLDDDAQQIAPLTTEVASQGTELDSPSEAVLAISELFAAELETIATEVDSFKQLVQTHINDNSKLISVIATNLNQLERKLDSEQYLQQESAVGVLTDIGNNNKLIQLGASSFQSAIVAEQNLINIPQGVTSQAKAITALFGKSISSSGEYLDPWPFKLVINGLSFVTAGRQINLQGAIVSGIARGDLQLSCVSGEINSIIVEVAGEIFTTTSERIGYISDLSGNPCVFGKVLSNFGKNLGKAFLAESIASASDLYVNSQLQLDRNFQTSPLVLNSSAIPNLSLGSGLGGSSSALAEWIRNRSERATEAVFVPSGIDLLVHISDNLQLKKVLHTNQI